MYAGFVFSGTGEDVSDSTTTDIKGGTGPKIGVGLTLLPFLDFNVEYRSITYKEEDLGSGVNRNVDYNAVMVGFSLPFVL